MDIAGWLRDLGLDRYEAAFRENDVNADILPKLTGDDLKDLGADRPASAWSCRPRLRPHAGAGGAGVPRRRRSAPAACRTGAGLRSHHVPERLQPTARLRGLREFHLLMAH